MIIQIAAIAILVLWPIFGFHLFKKDKGGTLDRIFVGAFFGLLTASLSIIFIGIIGLLILTAFGVVV